MSCHWGESGSGIVLNKQQEENCQIKKSCTLRIPFMNNTGNDECYSGLTNLLVYIPYRYIFYHQGRLELNLFCIEVRCHTKRRKRNEGCEIYL